MARIEQGDGPGDADCRLEAWEIDEGSRSGFGVGMKPAIDGYLLCSKKKNEAGHTLAAFPGPRADIRVEAAANQRVILLLPATKADHP